MINIYIYIYTHIYIYKDLKEINDDIDFRGHDKNMNAMMQVIRTCLDASRTR